MSQEDNIDAQEAAAEATQLGFVLPRIEKNDPPNIGAPRSKRMFTVLEEVDRLELSTAAGRLDTELEVVLPIGGLLHLGTGYRTAQSPEDLSDLPDILDDLAGVPTNHDWQLDRCQVPLMIHEQPPFEPGFLKEWDFGEFPKAKDVQASAMNTAKATEMVLTTDANAIIRLLTEEQMSTIPLGSEIYDNLSFVRRDWCEKDKRFAQILPAVVFYKRTKGGKYQIFVYQRGKGVGEERLAGGCAVLVGGHVNPHDFLSLQYKTVKLTAEDLGQGLSILAGNGAYEDQPTGRVLVEGFWQGIMNNLFREVGEEVKIVDKSNGEERLVNFQEFIEDEAESDTVGIEKWLYNHSVFFLDYAASDTERSHLGLFIGVEVPESFDITTNEEELIDVGFVDLETLQDPTNSDGTLPSALESWARSLVDSLSSTLVHRTLTSEQDFEGYGSWYRVYEHGQEESHPVTPETISKIPQSDRWKVGTLASIFNPVFKYYNYNVFVRS